MFRVWSVLVFLVLFFVSVFLFFVIFCLSVFVVFCRLSSFLSFFFFWRFCRVLAFFWRFGGFGVLLCCCYFVYPLPSYFNSLFNLI
jgi:hypothetical protein